MNLPENLLRCAKCGTGLLARGDANIVRCAACQATFPQHTGYVDLLPPSPAKSGHAQKTMEWPWLVRIYESGYWRRNPIIVWGLLGCTFEQEKARMFPKLNLKPGGRVLDLACGPGIFTRPIAQAVAPGFAIGLDLSEPMLSYATGRAREEGIDNVVWVRASAHDIPLADGSVDGVNCCGALHLFPDLPKVFAEIFRILKPGGHFTFGTSRRLGGLAGEVEVLTTKWSGLAVRTPELLRSTAEGVGFSEFRILHSRRIWQIGSMKRPE